MSATTTPPDIEHRSRRPSDRTIAVSAVGVVVVIAALILTLGYIPPPSFPHVADSPDAARTGQVAVLVGDDGSWHLDLVRASDGAVTRLSDGEGWPEVDALAWTTTGELALIGWPAEKERPMEGDESRRVRVLDPVTGEQTASLLLPTEGLPIWQEFSDRAADGTVARADGEGQVTVTTTAPDGTTTTLLDVDGPLGYWIERLAFSPDEAWLLASDSRGRVLVLPADGGTTAELYSTGRGRNVVATAWMQPDVTSGRIDLTAGAPR